MRRYLLGVCAVVLAISTTAFTIESSIFATDTYEYVGSDFAMGDDSDPLDDAENWSIANPSCPGPNKVIFCEAAVVSQSIKPTKQQVIDAIKAEYDRLAALNLTYTDGYTFQTTLNGETVSIQIFLKRVN